QKAVAVMLGGDGAVREPRLVEECKRELVSAIHDLVEENAVALCRVDRAQHVELGAVSHPAARVARRETDIHDAGVGGMSRIQLAVKPPAQPLVGARGAKGLSRGE